MGRGKPSASSLGKLSSLSHQRLWEVCVLTTYRQGVYSFTLWFPVISFQKQPKDVEKSQLISAVFW